MGLASAAGSDIGRMPGGMPLIVNGASFGIHGTSRSPSRSPTSSVAGSRMSLGRGVSPPASVMGSRRRSPSPHSALDAGPSRVRSQSPSQRWFQAMKANLEQYGDVSVFINEVPQECLCCFQRIETAYRVKPRKCDHVFHVECLLQWWTEGTCPVCQVSFAPDSKVNEELPEARLTERGSSTSAMRSNSWRQRSQSPPRLAMSSANIRMGSLPEAPPSHVQSPAPL